MRSLSSFAREVYRGGISEGEDVVRVVDRLSVGEEGGCSGGLESGEGDGGGREDMDEDMLVVVGRRESGVLSWEGVEWPEEGKRSPAVRERLARRVVKKAIAGNQRLNRYAWAKQGRGDRVPRAEGCGSPAEVLKPGILSPTAVDVSENKAAEEAVAVAKLRKVAEGEVGVGGGEM